MDCASGHPRPREVVVGQIQPQAMVRGGAEALPWWMGESNQLVMQAVHPGCNRYPGASTYRIPTERAATLEQWCAWVLELWPKTWLSRADLHRLLALWFTNRGIDYSSLS